MACVLWPKSRDTYIYHLPAAVTMPKVKSASSKKMNDYTTEFSDGIFTLTLTSPKIANVARIEFASLSRVWR